MFTSCANITVVPWIFGIISIKFSLNNTKLATLAIKAYVRKSKINSRKKVTSGGDSTQDPKTCILDIRELRIESLTIRFYVCAVSDDPCERGNTTVMISADEARQDAQIIGYVLLMTGSGFILLCQNCLFYPSLHICYSDSIATLLSRGVLDSLNFVPIHASLD